MEIASFMKKVLFKELDEVEIDEFINKLDEKAVQIENAFLSFHPHLPVFDFEIN